MSKFVRSYFLVLISNNSLLQIFIYLPLPHEAMTSLCFSHKPQFTWLLITVKVLIRCQFLYSNLHYVVGYNLGKLLEFAPWCLSVMRQQFIVRDGRLPNELFVICFIYTQEEYVQLLTWARLTAFGLCAKLCANHLPPLWHLFVSPWLLVFLFFFVFSFFASRPLGENLNVIFVTCNPAAGCEIITLCLRWKRFILLFFFQMWASQLWFFLFTGMYIQSVLCSCDWTYKTKP